jgi:hypothetical protein
MAQLNTKILKYCEANGVSSVDFRNEVKLKDDGDGVVYIHEWNLGIAEPTSEQLETYNSVATTEENNNVIKATRKSLYGSWDKQLEEINEQGIDSWKARLAQIKLDNPKE